MPLKQHAMRYKLNSATENCLSQFYLHESFTGSKLRLTNSDLLVSYFTAKKVLFSFTVYYHLQNCFIFQLPRKFAALNVAHKCHVLLFRKITPSCGLIVFIRNSVAWNTDTYW
jgi:hypothetical protein